MSNRTSGSSTSNGNTKGTAREARDKAEETIDDIGAQLAQMQQELAAITRSLAESGRIHAEAMADSVQDRSRRAAEAVGAQSGEFDRIARDALNEVERSAQRHPALTVGLAAGLGFLAALVLVRR